jgi:hypothetical protein
VAQWILAGPQPEQKRTFHFDGFVDPSESMVQIAEVGIGQRDFKGIETLPACYPQPQRAVLSLKTVARG